MKYLLYIPVYLVLLVSCKSTNQAITEENGQFFKVEIVQDGKVIAKVDEVVQLQKIPFQFKLTYYKTDHVYVAPSWDRVYYDHPDDKNIFWCDNINYEKCVFFPEKTGNEDEFNEAKDLYVGDYDYCFNWRYDVEKDWYVMDKGLEVKNGIIYSTVTVENIFDLDKRDTEAYEESEYNYPVQEVTQDIYMVFAADQLEKGMEYPKELQREKFILRFE